MTTNPATARRPVFRRGLYAVVVCVLAGLLLALALVPVVGGLGLVARAGAESFTELPTELTEPPLPQRSRILAADGSTLAEIFFNENRVLVSIDQVPRHVQLALLAIEDERFYEHQGLDFKGMLRALVRNTQAGTVRQGGSTITQQYVKNRLLENADDEEGQSAATERSTSRKIREARYAITLERRFTKQQILEKYLNIAYFGQGVYGIGTAALHYFGKPVHKLTVEEGALLAGLVKNPSLYDPAVKANRKTALARRNTVLARMGEVGFLPASKARAAQARPIRLRITKVASECEATIAPFFCAHLISSALGDRRFGSSPEERQRRLFEGGLTIRTTLDPAIQAAAQRAIESTIGRSKFGSAVVVVQPGTGEIRAMAVNRDYATYKNNLATGGSTGFQGGSTFKAFVLASAVEQGIPLRFRIFAPPKYVSPVFPGDPAHEDPACRKQYCVENAEPGESGSFDLEKGTWDSVNTFYVPLEERVGVLKAAAMARSLGLASLPLTGPDRIRSSEGSFTLGSQEVSPLDMATAYATLAARGLRCQPMAFTGAVAADGEELFASKPECTQVIKREVADTVNYVLQGVIERGTGKGADIGRPAAGKTGTTQGFGGAWFVGYTPQLSAAVWMGDPDPPKEPLQNVLGVRVVYGGTFPATIWAKTMAAAHAARPPSDFVRPPLKAIFGERVEVPDVRGLTADEARSILRRAGFNPVVSDKRLPAAPVPADRVAATNPARGERRTVGTTVQIFLSDGRSPPPPSPSPTPTPSPAPAPPPPECKPKKPCPTPTPTPTPTPPPPG